MLSLIQITIWYKACHYDWKLSFSLTFQIFISEICDFKYMKKVVDQANEMFYATICCNKIPNENLKTIVKGEGGYDEHPSSSKGRNTAKTVKKF